MTLTRKIAGLLLVVFLFHQSSGVEEFCKSLCTRELGSEKENETRSEASRVYYIYIYNIYNII